MLSWMASAAEGKSQEHGTQPAKFKCVGRQDIH